MAFDIYAPIPNCRYISSSYNFKLNTKMLKIEGKMRTHINAKIWGSKLID